MSPKITIIVPTLNESDHIVQCIESLEQQSYPASDREILIVDNGSSDKTVELAQGCGARVLHEPRKSAYWARNLGIENSTSDWIAFTDADCLANPNWIENLLKTAEERGAILVGGLIEYEMCLQTMGNRILIETHQPDQLRERIEKSHCVAGGNLFVHRSAFSEFGLFNVIEWGSDIEFSKRVARRGGNVSFAEDAVVRHQCDLSNWEYLRRCYETRFGQVCLFDDRAGFLAMLRNLKQIPWRPGFRSGANRFRSESVAPANPIVDWAYRWAIRWMEFIGESHGLVKNKTGSQIHPASHDPSNA